jgi:hypothetical protein
MHLENSHNPACQDCLQEFDRDLSSDNDTSNTNFIGCTTKQKACPRPVLQHGGYQEASDSLFDDHLATDPTGDTFGDYQAMNLEEIGDIADDAAMVCSLS